MKRIVSLILAVSMVLSMFTMSFAGLKDVEGTKYEAAVEALIELGVVNGYPDGTYLPNNVVTRAELAKLLVTAYGLEAAAEASKGATPFSDVAENHWAAGYVNVAADYGFVNGYPDGEFKGDATVTYAEAITMCLRVLGYTREVESKGTWPTNYIAKAQDLKLMKDISYGSYNDGAKRGNVALLIWNMLRTPMWEVTEESEGDGLVSRAQREMINVKFSDYTYYDEDLELVVKDIDVEDGKVTIYAASERGSYDEDGDFIPAMAIEAELAEDVDFVNLFGRTVSILYNKEDAEIIMITPSSEDKVVEGFYDELDEENYNFEAANQFLWGEDGDFYSNDYLVAVLGTKKNAESATVYHVKAGIVDSIKVKNDKATIKFSYGNLSTINNLDEDAIVLVDGKWGNFEDIKEGDVLTELVAGELYAITRETVTGSLDEVKYEEDREEHGYYVVVDGKEYEFLTTWVAVEIDEDGEDVTETDLDDIMDAKKDDPEYKFYDEDATLYFNFVGEVIRVEFEEIEDVEATGHFYVLTNKLPTWTVSDKSGTTTYVELNGESYEVKSGVDVSALENEAGEVVFVKFDNKDKVKEITLVPYDDVLDKYTFDEGTLSDKNYINVSKVNDSTVVYKITEVLDEDDELECYEVKTSKGTADLENVDYILYCYETEDSFKRAKYAFVWEDGVSDEMYGIVENYKYTKGIAYLTIDGKVYEVNENCDVDSDVVGTLVVFNEGSDGIKVLNAVEIEDIKNMGIQVTRDNIDNELSFTWGQELFDMDIFEDEIDKNCKVFFVEVSENSDDDDYHFDSIEEVSIDEITLKNKDVVFFGPADGDYGDIEIFMVVRGFDTIEILP